LTPPAWKSSYNLARDTNPGSGAVEDIAPLCIWPPNLEYHCWLDVLSSRNDQVSRGSERALRLAWWMLKTMANEAAMWPFWLFADTGRDPEIRVLSACS
jgi:hypothetical protein